jgi:transcriptional regulator with XRE-family HTH domain
MGAMLGQLIQRDREQAGLTLGEAPRRLHIPPRQLERIEAGEIWPDWETYDRIVRLTHPQQFDLEPDPQVVVGLEVDEQVRHPRIPLGQLADQAGSLRCGGSQVTQEVTT